jgi:hypothetical protein
MNPFEGEDRHTWQGASQGSEGHSGVEQESKPIDEWLGQLPYAGRALTPRPRRFAFAAPLLLLLLGLGAGGVGGWFLGRRELPPSSQEAPVPPPDDVMTGPEGIMAEGEGWQLVWKGEVLPWDAPAIPSPPPEAVPPPPLPREEVRPRGPGNPLTKGYLGVRGKTFQQEGIEGVKILEVFPDSPAAKAGLRSDSDPDPHRDGKTGEGTGHIIVAANGQTMRSEEDLAQMMDLSAPGDVMQVVVTAADGDVREAIIVVLDRQPQSAPPAN